ncbi:MAG: adenosylcobalamin-dependent ribonucleoside-diphosphate reductase [Candidatus Aenigmatarchaeota archaeon]
MREEILEKRYYLKDSYGNPVEDWEGLCRRVAGAVAFSKEEEDQFYGVVKNCLFLPNSPALMNAGKERFSLSACFVLPVEDSMESIFEAVKNAAIIHKSGGGTGFSFSRLRPAGDVVGSTKGVSSGPVSFMTVFDAATEAVKQGGARRGANMGILRVDHPDILEFIKCKDENTRLNNFNISVGLTAEFMKAFEEDREYELINPRTGKAVKRLRAVDVFNLIVKQAWKNGEPGIVFLDRLNAANPTPELGEIEATNPCGEQPLLPYEACVLGSINLSKMVTDGSVDYGRIGAAVHAGIRMLDNIIDIQHYPLPQIEAMHRANRKIGLGVMGWADMLIQLEIPYNSQEALNLAEKVMAFIQSKGWEASRELAEEKGVFPNYRGSIYNRGFPVRNATVTTIAPTGSLSIIAGCSSGIEPVFEWETIQRRESFGEHRVVHPLYAEWVRANPGKPLPLWFVTAKEISPEWHIRMQAAFQKYVDNAVSKTVNLPGDATPDDVREVYLLAYKLGCKGVTVYRDGSREEQVISSAANSANTEATASDADLPAVMDSKRVRVETFEGKVYVNISLWGGNPREVFIHTPVESKHSEIYESFARIFSCALRYGVPARSLLSQLEKANKKYGSVSSIPSAILRAFRMIGINGKTEDSCPDCGGILVLEEGCVKCLSCGYSKC